ncbi:MAG: Uma2 family endonuclease [Hyphomicrobiaceae bacterium]
MTAHAQMYVDKATFYRFIVNADERHRYEYVRGWIMQRQTGGTLKHSSIGARFVVLLSHRLDPALWAVNGSDRGIDTGATVRYADASVERKGAPTDSLSTKSPIIVIEVLSPSSEERDLGAKPAEYLSIPSLEAYIVASQEGAACWTWVRGADRQFPRDPIALAGPDKIVDIPALSLSIPLADVYRDIIDATAAGT